MVNHIETTELAREKVTPWWERSKVYGGMWHGSLFDRMILSGDDEEEQRIQGLRERALERPQGKRGYLCIWRAKLLTDSYRETEGETPALRKAKAFKHICENIPINHREGQLLMGEHTTASPGTQVEPEWTGWLNRDVFVTELGETMSEVDAIDVRGTEAWVLNEEDKRILKEYIIPYWQDINHEAVVQKQLEENFPQVNFKEGHFVGRASYPGSGHAVCHTVPDFASTLKKGLKGLKEEIRASMDKIDGSDIQDNHDIDRVNIYKAMIIAADSIIKYANRCADLAEEMAKEESNPERKTEYKEMARVCRKVPEHPADSWWEALQSLYFLFWAIHMCDGGTAHSLGRFDQYMYPYLKNDLETGKITRKRTQELLECLFIRIRERTMLLHCRAAKRLRALHNQCKIDYGGVDSKGQDATNELSFMILEAHAHTHFDDPEPTLQWHKNTPDSILKATLEVLRLGSGQPHIINADVIIPSLMGRGVTLGEARNFSDLGCQENVTDPNTSGADTNPRSNAGWFNIPKLVEFALFNGVDRTSGAQCGPKTGDARFFGSMDEFFQAVKEQTEYAVYVNCIYNNLMDWAYVKSQPVPVLNLLHPGPRQSGIDYQGGGCKHNWTGGIGVGVGTAADALAAIEWLIYDKKEITMKQLIEALDHNWEGCEEIRQKCHEAPKYGKDDDYADKWAVRMSEVWMDAYEKHRTFHRGIFVGGLFSTSTYVFIGSETWASADGRGAGEPLAAAIDPSNMTDLEGPTRLHKSAAKIDTLRTTNGIAFNCRFPLSTVGSERELSKWADLVRAYMLMGGQAVQYNVVSTEALMEAQVHPDDYKDLIVRVGGYSALFVDLDKDTQDTIIARAEHHL